MAGYLFFGAFFLAVFIWMFIDALKHSTGDGFPLGVVAGLILTLSGICFTLGICSGLRHDEQFKTRVTDVTELKVDTVFTTINNMTDTAFIVYYNK